MSRPKFKRYREAMSHVGGEESERSYRRKERNGNRSETPKKPKHPPGLKGKEIGLFYARRDRGRRRLFVDKPIGGIKLSDTKKLQIREMLKSNSVEHLLKLDNSYSHVKESLFKKSFLSTINGNMSDKISNTSISDILQNDVLDEAYYQEFVEKNKDPMYISMLKERMKLPSFASRAALLKLIEENQVVVISGETGCGKTTQVSQYILEHYVANRKGSLCKVVCTQPRRISAISVAERVAVERAEKIGKTVGYQIRLERQIPREWGSVCFCTTGIILKQMEDDPGLHAVSHLILDEIHERNVPSDFLITILRQVIRKRKDLKIILMSATLNSQAFSKYFDNCPHINIPGFTYPITEYFLEDVLQRTRYKFKEMLLPGGNCGGSYRKWMQYRDKKRNLRESTFDQYIIPYARQLQREGKYDEDVCRQLKNPESEKINMNLILELLIDICSKEDDDGSILVFLTGFVEISALFDSLQRCRKFPSQKYIILPLHSQMPSVDQKQIFNPAPPGKRKIILSTNIAETSITIDDVMYVIDCGKIKMSNYDIEAKTETLQPEWVALANANQRRGRAGRVKPGVCFHLYSRARYMILEKFQKPEIQRVELDDVILTAKILQIRKVQLFFRDLMDPPDEESVSFALNLLKRLNAIDEDENLTPLGFHLAKLPISPRIGKMILFGAIFSCLDPILSIASSLDFKDPFLIPLGQTKEADLKRRELAGGWKSDHLLFHKVIEMYEKKRGAKGFCWNYFLSSYTLDLLINMKKQFMTYLKDLNFVSNADPKNIVNNKNSGNLSLVKAIICAGLYPNIAVVRQRTNTHGRVVGQIRLMDGEKRLEFHMKSVLHGVKNFESPLIVYHKKVKTSSEFIYDASIVYPLPIIFFGDNIEQTSEGSGNIISINKSLKFTSDQVTTRVIMELRDKLNWFLEYKITHPGVVDWNDDTDQVNILRAIMELITSEEIGDIYNLDEDDELSDN